MNTFYLTTPIYYPNARPHVGSAYTTIVCDVLARYKRMCGYDVAFLTGTDEHGEKLQRAAAEAGKLPREFVAEKRQLFIDLWKKLGIDPVVYPYEQSVPRGAMRFVYTDHPDHFKSVRRMLLRARANKIDGQDIIYKKRYEGRYCIFDEMYVSEGSDPINCPNCGRPTELISEENYFFRLSAYKERLLDHYDKHPDFVRPNFRMNEVKNFVKDLRDISISRKRIKWGIPFPLDEDHDDPEQVFYVWYDALVSYMTGVGYAQGENGSETFQKYWRNSRDSGSGTRDSGLGKGGSSSVDSRLRGNDGDPNPELQTPNPGLGNAELVHMVGKDILRFHAVYWPAFIMAAYPGQPEMLPTTVFAHGWIYYEQDKMSKSKDNVVYPEPIVDALESFGAPGNDALRYYLLREAPFGHDTSFSYEALIQRYNSDLANDLGNLANRTITMLHQFFGGEIPPRPALTMENPFWDIRVNYEEYPRSLAGFDFSDALGVVGHRISLENKRVNDARPWLLAKSSLLRDREILQRTLYERADFLRAICVLLRPVMPLSMEHLWKQLGCEDYLGKLGDQRIDQVKWGGLKPGTKVGKPEPIFPRLDKAQTLAKLEELAEADRARSQPKGVQVSQELSAVSRQPSVVSGQPSASAESRTPKTESRPTTDNQQPTTGKISIDDFSKVEMVVGQILSAEPIPKAQKLLKLQVDIGAETRQVCAGIAEFYKPEEVTGMKIVLVANLEPRKLRGVESNGMVVAASIGPEGRPVLATFKEDVPNGTRLK
jgi:methionyl-tRNA synthetase